MEALLKSTSIGAITLFTEDLTRSRAFYQEVFGLPVVFEDENSAVFKFGETLVNLLEAPGPARELVEPGIVAPRESGTRAVFTIEVEAIDEVCAELARRGATLLNGPMDRPWGIRTASFTDPGGHVWEIAQGIPAADE